MNVFEIYKSAIEAGDYSIGQMTERIETVYACGKITKSERAELLDMVSENGDHLDTQEIMNRLADIENRLSAIEQTGVKVWVKGSVTAKNQVVLYDVFGDGLRYCRYVGSRESTANRPCSAWGWEILDGINGKVTHRTVKTDDGTIIQEVTEE